MCSQRIRDPLHNLIEFDTSRNEFENVLWGVIQTRPFQRLRRVKQLGFSDLVYPGAVHSRLAHSIGVFHTARRLMRVIERHVPRPEETKMHQSLAAALVHDVGHGPFSHAFESVGKRLNLKMAEHEHVSDTLIRDSEIAAQLQNLGSGFAADVADVVKGRGKNHIYRAVVTSQFDADRLDYMQRDRIMTGVQHGAIDFEWLLANLEIGTVPYGVDEEALGDVETFVLSPKAIYAAEAFVLGLFQLYPTVYFHKATRSAEKLYTELLCRIVVLVKDGSIENTGLPNNHALVQFANNPDEIASALALDDTVIWGALSLLADARDPCVAELATRLRDRRLYKCSDIRAAAEAKITPDKIDEKCAAISEKLTDWSAQNSLGSPRILIDQATRSPYKRLEETKGPLDQINIRTLGNKLVDLSSQSEVVGAIKAFTLFRAYVAGEDHEAKSAVEKITAGELS
jgi:HD superfamily phosphohydrolase